MIEEEKEGPLLAALTLLLYNSPKARELKATSYYTYQGKDPLTKPLTDTLQESGQGTSLSQEEAINAFCHCKQNKVTNLNMKMSSFNKRFLLRRAKQDTMLGSIADRLLRTLGHNWLQACHPLAGLFANESQGCKGRVGEGGDGS